MNSYLNDFLKIIRSRAGIISIIVIILFSLVVGYASESSFISSNPASTLSMAPGYYSNSTEIHFATQVYNGYGQGVSGKIVNYSLMVNTNTGAVNRYYDVVSGHDGFANLTFMSFPGEIMSTFGNKSQPPAMLASAALPGQPYSSGMPLPVFFNWTGTTYWLSIVRNPSHPLQGMIHVAFIGPPANFTNSVGIYYSNNTKDYFTNLSSTTGYHLVANISGFSAINLPISLKVNSSQTYIFAAFNSNGELAGETSGSISFVPPSSQILTVFFSASSGIMSEFVPLLAVFAGYFFFGKERVDGVIESVLVRPVTRGSVIISRYVASVVLFAIASAAGLLTVYLFVGFYTGYYIPPVYLGYAFWGLLVMCGGFIGLVYLTSIFMKSVGAMLGLSIGIYIVMSFLWGLISLIIGMLLGRSLGSTGFIHIYITMLYLSPSGYLTLESTIATNSFIFGPVSSLSSLGLSEAGVIAGGILWLAVPFILAAILFVRRD
jgi:ABC-2 type transport system permease protein